MDIILLQNTPLGRLGDRVKVRRGYASNYLVPQGIATWATKANIADFEARRGELEKAADERLYTAKTRAEKLEQLGELTVGAHASEEGKLFGSVGTRELSEAITKAGVPIEKSEVLLAEGALRQVGEYDIGLQLHSDVRAIIKIIVAAE